MKQSINYLTLFFLSFFALGVMAQSNELLINEVEIEGLKRNNEEYLRRFITSKQGDPINFDKIEKDLQQLRRRTGVAHAEMLLDTISANSLNLRFLIREQRTLLPQLGLGGIQNNFWWQVGIEEHNLFGKEQAILLNYLHNDGRPNFKIFFQNARIKASPWGVAFDLNHNASIEPLYFEESTVDFRYSNSGAGFAVIRNFGFNQRALFGANIFKESYEKNNPEDFGVTEGPDFLDQNKLLFKASFENNQLGYDNFYRSGYQWLLLGQSVSNLSDRSLFLSLGFEAINYWRPFKGSNVALRLKAAIATNTPSPFAPFVLDSRVNLRGVGNRVDRGTAQFVINLEWRQTVFHTNRWAGQIVAFSDSGTWRNPGGELNDLFDTNQFRQFIGGGIRFINKKVFKSTLRLDYGFDLWNANQNGIVFGVGQYF